MQQPSDLRSMLAHSLRENAMPVGLVAAYIAGAMVLADQFGFALNMDPRTTLILFSAFFLFIGISCLLTVLARERPESPIRLLLHLPGRWRLPERAILAAPALLAMAIFFPAFGSLKAAIPVLNAYRLDPLFSQMDIAIHGRPAWELLHPLLGYPIVSFLLSGLYHLWLAAVYLAVCSVALFADRLEVRRQFLIAFVLCWALLGNAGATLLASVGPCFYNVFYSEDPYSGLMSYLREADQVLPLAVLDVQDKLIGWQSEGKPGLGRGISAMPSMHVAMACLIMLLCWQVGRLWAWAGTLFLIGIVLGSIHLAYHYAVDGYFSLLATPLIWWAAKPLAAFKGFSGAKLVTPEPAEANNYG